MQEQKKVFKRIFCPVCRTEVEAEYRGRIGEIDRYECPNELEPDERHGIYEVIPQPHQEALPEKSIEYLPKNVQVSGVAMPSDDKTGFTSIAKQTLEGYGMSVLLDKTIFRHKSSPRHQEDKGSHPSRNDQSEQVGYDNSDDNIHHFSQEYIETPNFEIPKIENIDISEVMTNLKLDWSNLPNPDIDPDSLDPDHFADFFSGW